MLVAILLLAATLRMAIVVVPPVLGILSAEIGLGTASASVLAMLPLIAFGIGGLSGSWIIDRLGLERTAALGMILAAAAQLARALVTAPSGFLVTSSVAIFGLGLGNVVAPPLVKRYFPRRLGLVTGLYVVSLQVGTALGSQFTVPLASSGLGWRGDFALWGAVCAVAALPWVLAARGTSPGQPNRLAQMPTGVPVARLYRSPLAWAILVMFAVQSSLAYALIAWLPSMLIHAGVEPFRAASALALFAVFQIPMSLFAPVLLTRLRRPFWLIASFSAAYLVAFGGLMIAPAQGWFVWAALLGIGSGPFPVALALIGLRTATPGAAASLSGFVQGVGYPLAAPGPFVVGFIFDHFGSWTPALAFMVALLGPAVASARIVSRPAMVE